jgi:hypothetical protein
MPPSTPPPTTNTTPTETIEPEITVVVASDGIETKNLKIHYPEFVEEETAKDQAKILQQAYDFYYNLIGQEYPYNGDRINIIFDSSLGYVSHAGNPITMGADSGIFDGKMLPPEPSFFHEIVHDFTTSDRASVAKYVDINGAITEAIADLFTFYFAHEKLKYSQDDVNRYTQWEISFRNLLSEYETNKTDPYILDWGGHKDAQPFICSIFFFISEKYGWEVWDRFFQVARKSNIEGIPLLKRGSFIDLKTNEATLAFGDFVYILSIASGENLIPAFENWGFHFETQTQDTVSDMYKTHSEYLSWLASQYYEDALNKLNAEDYVKTIEILMISSGIYDNLGDVQNAQEIMDFIEEIKSKYIIIDGFINEWPSNAVMVSDPSGDVSYDVTSVNGTDLKAVYAFMDEKYLYVAIQIVGEFDSSLLRNYFIAVDFNGDQQDEYHFGLRPNGDTWVFDHTADKNNWNAESTSGVLAVGGKDTIEIRISREKYDIPSSIFVYSRVTGGGATFDLTAWFHVIQTTFVLVP